VFGHEHYAEHLEDLACAAVPVRHPISGKAAGAVNLTSWRKDAGRLLIALAQSTARQVTQGLLNAPHKTPRPRTMTDRRIVRRSRAWRFCHGGTRSELAAGPRAGRRALGTANHRAPVMSKAAWLWRSFTGWPRNFHCGRAAELLHITQPHCRGRSAPPLATIFVGRSGRIGCGEPNRSVLGQ
jgi:hypothetical protein